MISITQGLTFEAFIHTVQIGSTVESITADEAYHKPYVVRRPYYCGDKIHYVINPNKLIGEFEVITNYSEFIEALELIINDLQLIDSVWQIERFDLAVHTNADYDYLFKKNCYITDLFACMSNCDNNYKVIDHRLQYRTTVVKNNCYELEVYNKHIESGCKIWPITRCEFRFKSLAKIKILSMAEIINSRIAKALNFLETAPDFTSNIDDSMSKYLIQKFRKQYNDSSCKRSKLFNYFVAQNVGFIYNRNILRSLYAQTCNGSFKDWLYRFSNSGINLDLVSAEDLNDYCNHISQAIRAYIQSPFPR